MKKNLLLKRILSAVLTIVLLASAIPVSLAVQELFTEELPAQIVREVPELREESVKHFLCDDGSYIAATYAEPVHYNENGVWKEIDNRLILNSNKLSASGEPTYTTRAGLAVSIPQNFADGQKITAENKGYEISFGIKADQAGVAIGRGASVVAVDELMSNVGAQVSAAPQSVSSVVADAELTADVIEERNAELMVVENQAGAVQYRNILPSTNLEYAVTSSSVKESIVVREPQSEYKYYFDMDLDGLTPVENNDGSISLTESGDTANEIFWIEAPYMYDANSDESFAVTMSLTEVEGKYVLAVEADKDWINAADRAFPVVIDPTLHLSGTYIDDAFVISGLQMNSLRRGKELRVGRNLTNLTRTYMKIKMPVNISAQSVIQEATLKLKKASYFQALGQSNVNINVYDFKSNSWSFDSLEWNSQPYGNGDNAFRSHGDDLLDSVPANKQTETYSFNILNAVKRWIATGDNRGIALVSSEETSKAQVDLHSSRVSTSSDRPSLTIKYSLPGIGRVSLMLDQTAQTSQSIEVACNGAWTATTDSSWITVSPSSGSGLSSIRITVRKNRSIDPRTGHVTVKTGSTMLGVLRVTQAGSKLMLDTNAVTAYYKETNAVINVSSAEDWTVETPNWIVATPSSGSGNTAVTVRILENEGNGIRDDRIRFSTASDSEEVAVTQLDRVSSCFNNIDSYGNVTAVTASDYNHRLATWAMELSYAAYNYPNGEELPIIPGAFMGDFTQTAGMLLEDNGFVNISEYNYTSDDRAAHTIGCRLVEFPESENLQLNDYTGGIDNVYQYSGADLQLSVLDLLDSLSVNRHTSLSDKRRDIGVDRYDSITDSQSFSAGNIILKPLVVVDIRGSVTWWDWINDIGTQVLAHNNRFAALAEEVFTNVENFYSVSENGSFGRNSSSDYNHKLATWAMELSYAAYNYPNGEELPIIPGAFMGDFTKTAGMLLEDNGFVNISEYNYTSDSRAAHTIGWRPVEVAVSETSQIINDAGGMDNVYQYNIDDKGSVLYNLLDSVCVYERNTCRSNSGNPEIMDRNVDVLEVSENSLATTTIKNLVVIDIRGSVTLLDWGNDIVTQLASNNNRFAALADEVLTNVESYLSSVGLQDPIILITGHSMGAAIANILAVRLNETMDSGNIYAYTFTFTRWQWIIWYVFFGFLWY